MENEAENKFKPISGFDTKIKPKRKTSRFHRGTFCLCLVFSPGQRFGQLVNLRKEENLLISKSENQKFIILEAPAISFSFENRSYPVFVCDAEKGVTVSLDFEKEKELAKLYCDPKMLSNVFDETFISRASGIKPDYKQLLGIALFALSFGFLFGLIF